MTPPLVQVLFGKIKIKIIKKRKKEKRNEKKKTKKKKTRQRKKRRVPRRAISTGHRVQEHNPSCYKWPRRGEESKLPPLLYEPSTAELYNRFPKPGGLRTCGGRESRQPNVTPKPIS
jgi:hypothetical protein